MASYVKTLTEELAVADRRTWSDMVFTWDDYTGTWDSYGELPITKIWGVIRVFTETITHTETFSRIAIVYRTLTDTISHVESFSKKTIKTISDSISHSEAFNRVATSLRTLTDTLTHTESIKRLGVRTLNDSMALVESFVKTPIKRISEALGMTEMFSRGISYTRTIIDTLNVIEKDWTWDMMVKTWDDYTEEWQYYGQAFSLIKILSRKVEDTFTITDNEPLFARVKTALKNAYIRMKSILPYGKMGSGAIIGRISGQNSIGKVSSTQLSGRVRDNNRLIGK